MSDHSLPLHESHIEFKHYLLLQKEPKFVIFITIWFEVYGNLVLESCLKQLTAKTNPD